LAQAREHDNQPQKVKTLSITKTELKNRRVTMAGER